MPRSDVRIIDRRPLDVGVIPVVDAADTAAEILKAISDVHGTWKGPVAPVALS
jgi:hypothetical protein